MAVRATCTGGAMAPPAAVRWSGHGHYTCLNTRRMYIAAHPGPPAEPIHIHGNCACAELTAVTTRVFGSEIRPTPEAIRRLRTSMRALTGRIVRLLQPVAVCIPLPMVAAHYSGAKREAYARAAESLRTRPITRADAAVQAFVKADKITSGKRGDPRMIQFRSTRYTCLLASYLRPVERRLSAITSLRSFGVELRTPLIAKGLNSTQRARLVKLKSTQFASLVIHTMDFERFDRTVSVETLEVEHAVYNRIYNCPVLARLLSWQLKNRCRTRGGWHYTIDGRRMSGDYNTSLGNTLQACSALTAALQELCVPKFDLLVDGDDCLIFTESGMLDEDLLTTALMRYGFKAGFGARMTRLPGLIFGRSRYVEFPTGARFVRDWQRHLATMFVSHRYYDSGTYGKRYAKTLASAELRVNGDVPIVHAWARLALERLTGEKVLKTLPPGHYRLKLELEGVKDRSPVPTMAHRVAFADAFGVSVEQQLALEHALGSRMGSFERVPPIQTAAWTDGSPCDAPWTFETFGARVPPW